AVAPAHILLDLHDQFPVGEHLGRCAPQREVQVRADARREFLRVPSSEDLQAVRVARAHALPPCAAGASSLSDRRLRRILSTAASCSGVLMLSTSSGGTASISSTRSPASRSMPGTSVR